MKICPNCKNEIVDEAAFCPVCGAGQNAAPAFDAGHQPNWQAQYNGAPVYAPPQPVVDPYDHTKEFSPEDIHENKLACMLIYMMGIVGIVIAALLTKDSPYVKFHIRQGLKFTVTGALLSIVTAVLCWTVIVPILSGIAVVVLYIIKCISFVQVCSNKACEPAILRGIGFLK